MNTTQADMNVGQMLLLLTDEGEGSCVPGVGFIEEKRKRSVAAEVSRELKRLIGAGLLCLLISSGTASAQNIEAAIPGLVQKIVVAESSGNPRAIGDHGHSRGLMQIKEGTWRRHTTASWSRAFEPALNIEVGTAEIRRIIRTYRAAGIEPSAAYVLWTYNTGSFVKRFLPKYDRLGRLHAWTWNHPNAIYRQVYREFLK